MASDIFYGSNIHKLFSQFNTVPYPPLLYPAFLNVYFIPVKLAVRC